MSTEGSAYMLKRQGLTWSLTRFALPIIGSGVVQQSFNSVDIAVVGNLVGSHALAAVGANGPVISLIVTLFMGIALGANVTIARAIGARNPRVVEKSVETQWALSLYLGAFLLLFGLVIARPLLTLLGTPDSILNDAVLYLQIYAAGFPGMLIYNFCSAVLRSVGDTLWPFLWLVFGGLVNVVLNLVLVIWFDWGVEGVALGTTASNYVSAIGVVVILMRKRGELHLALRRIKVYRAECMAMIRIGIPAGLQGTLFALSNVVIQSAVNALGPEAIAGNAAAIVYEVYGYFIISAFVQAAVSFVSINYGAAQYDMCRAVFWRAMLLSIVYTLVFNGIVDIIAPQAVGILTDSAAAREFGVLRVRIALVWQAIASSYEIAGGALRGLGYSVLPMIITLLGTCVVRILYVKYTHYADTLTGISWIYPITWVITGVAMLTVYFWLTRRIFSRPRQKLVV